MRIAIVNDMPMAVEALRRALSLEPAHQVVWVANNGLEAVQRCAELTPDLILMDLIMPAMIWRVASTPSITGMIRSIQINPREKFN